jgi:hypothetical protein
MTWVDCFRRIKAGLTLQVGDIVRDVSLSGHPIGKIVEIYGDRCTVSYPNMKLHNVHTNSIYLDMRERSRR